MTHKNKLISTTPSLEEILQQLPIKETHTADLKILAIIKTALLLGFFYTIVKLMIGNQFYPTALEDGFIFGFVFFILLYIIRIVLNKLFYPFMTILDEEGIHIKVRNREEIIIPWLQIVQFSKIKDMSNSWVTCKTSSQIDKQKIPKRFSLISTIYDVDTTVAILKMLHQHFTTPPQTLDL